MKQKIAIAAALLLVAAGYVSTAHAVRNDPIGRECFPTSGGTIICCVYFEDGYICEPG